MKSIVIYFSRTGENYAVGNISVGNTEVIANYIKEITGADTFKIEPKTEYPDSYHECIEVAQIELHQDARPEVKSYLDSIDEYDTIYIGYPIWWGTMPMCVYTFLEHYDFSGKTIKPFATHEGSGLASSVLDLKRILPNSNVKDGLAIQGSMVSSAKDKVCVWINE